MALFKLEIRIDDSSKGFYSVSLEGTDPKREPVTFHEAELDEPIDEIKRPMSRLYTRGIPANATDPVPFTDFETQDKVCNKIGERLFKSFFVGSVAERFEEYKKENQYPRLALRLPPELYHLPWELLYDPADEYCLSIQGSITRYDAKTPERLFQPLDSSSLLFFVAKPQDKGPIADLSLLDVPRFQFIKVSPASYAKLQAFMVETRFGLVFFGHGEIDDQKHGQLIFEREERDWMRLILLSDPKYGHSLRDAFSPKAEMRLACIFACESAWAKKEVRFDNSIVGSFLRKGKVAHVLGAQTKIDVFAGQECLVGIFKGLADGNPLDLALSKGRIAVRAIPAGRPGGVAASLDWWIPVLYSKTTHLDILPQAAEINAPEGIAKEARPMTSIPISLTSFGEAGDLVKAVSQKLAHVLSGESNRFRDI